MKHGPAIAFLFSILIALFGGDPDASAQPPPDPGPDYTVPPGYPKAARTIRYSSFGDARVRVFLRRGISEETFFSNVRRNGVLDPARLLRAGRGARWLAARLNPLEIEALARLDSVALIWPRGRRVQNDNAKSADTSNIDEIVPAGLGQYHLTGSGFDIGLWELGSPRVTHRQYAGRVVIIEASENIGESNPLNSHASHVCATIIGDGTGKAAARGMASEARVGAFIVTDDDDPAYEMRLAADRITAANHSWGFTTGWYRDGNTWVWAPGDESEEDAAFGKYDPEAANWDSLVYDTGLIVVKSAGNDRADGGAGGAHEHEGVEGTFEDFHYPDTRKGGFDTLSSLACAKNVLIVGAVNDLEDDPPLPDDDSMTHFSSWGPTDDGRVKPDIVANGWSLFSATSSGDSNYTWMSGTSMAAPTVTGTVSLLAELYQRYYGPPGIAPDLLRGLLCHTAVDGGAIPGPDPQFGWGLMDARAAADLVAANGATGAHFYRDSITSQAVLLSAESLGAEPVSVTLVWTDPPGPVNTGPIDDDAPALVHDLDLALRGPDDTLFFPYRLQGDAPTSAALTNGPNHVDNIERVDVGAPQEGTWRIEVTRSDSRLTETQSFALIVTGLRGGSWQTRPTRVRDSWILYP